VIDRDKAHALLDKIIEADAKGVEAADWTQELPVVREAYASFIKLAGLLKAPIQNALDEHWHLAIKQEVAVSNPKLSEGDMLHAQISDEDLRRADLSMLARLLYDMSGLLPPRPDRDVARLAANDMLRLLRAGIPELLRTSPRPRGQKRSPLVLDFQRALVQAVYFEAGCNPCTVPDAYAKLYAPLDDPDLHPDVDTRGTFEGWSKDADPKNKKRSKWTEAGEKHAQELPLEGDDQLVKTSWLAVTKVGPRRMRELCATRARPSRPRTKRPSRP
jgi:hypothetical protein